VSACRAALNVKGEHIHCELDYPHTGLAHQNGDAQAIWCSHNEAQRAAHVKLTST
jgi:hypothetical protein